MTEQSKVVGIIVNGKFLCVETDTNKQPCAALMWSDNPITENDIAGQGLVQCQGCGLVIQGSPIDPYEFP